MDALLRILKPLRKIVVAVGILVLGLVGFMTLVATKPDVPARPNTPDVRIVEAVVTEMITAQPNHKAFGTVTASRTADLRFNINGEVAEVAQEMKNGALVMAGQELARLDDEVLRLNQRDVQIQLEAERDNLTELQTQFDLRQRQFARVNEMAAASVVSESRLDEAKLALSAAKTALRQSASRRDQLQVRLKQINRNIADSHLTAPFDGVLSDVVIGEGRVVSSQNVLGTLTDLSSLEVSFIVPAEIYADSGSLISQYVEVTWTSGGRDVETVAAQIMRTEGLIKANEGGGRLYAILPDTDVGQNAPIPPGAFVEIAYPSAILENVFVLPDTALYDNGTVFVVEGGVAVARAIQIMSKADGLIYVRGDLADGETVITTRLPGLGEGVRVTVAES